MTCSSIKKASQETYCVDFFLETSKGALYSFIFTTDPYLTDKETLPLLIEETAAVNEAFAKQLWDLEVEFGAITPRFDDISVHQPNGECPPHWEEPYAYISSFFE